MTSDQTGLRVAAAWLAGASLLLAIGLSFHGPRRKRSHDITAGSYA